jgi:fido (protein-threonine AMPylation protein)
MIEPETALSAGQRAALDNLARKQAGEDVDWISIADARSLTDLGLAERNRAGWTITAAGAAALEAAAAPPEADRVPSSVTPISEPFGPT